MIRGCIPRRASRHVRQTRLRRLRACAVLSSAASVAQAMLSQMCDGSVGSVACVSLARRLTFVASDRTHAVANPVSALPIVIGFKLASSIEEQKQGVGCKEQSDESCAFA